MHRNGKAARHLLEAAVDDLLLPEGSVSYIVFEGAMLGGVGEILSDLASKATQLRGHRRASELRNEINGEVEDFESWMDGALEDGVYAAETTPTNQPYDCYFFGGALSRNLKRLYPSRRKDEAEQKTQ